MAKVDQAKETLWCGWRAGEVGISSPWSSLLLWAVPEVPIVVALFPGRWFSTFLMLRPFNPVPKVVKLFPLLLR